VVVDGRVPTTVVRGVDLVVAVVNDEVGGDVARVVEAALAGTVVWAPAGAERRLPTNTTSVDSVASASAATDRALLIMGPVLPLWP
jgi:hypothetical protein